MSDNLLDGIILPGMSGESTSDLVQEDFVKDIVSDKIKTSFLSETSDFEFPLYYIDFSNMGINSGTIIKALSLLLLNESDLSDIDYVHIYIKSNLGQELKIGIMREETARVLLPTFVRKSLGDSAILLYSKDGINFMNVSEGNTQVIKLEFDE